MKVVMFFVKLLVLGAVFIISNQDLALSVPGNFEIFGELYFNWIAGLGESAQAITGYVVDVDWLPHTPNDPTLAGR